MTQKNPSNDASNTELIKQLSQLSREIGSLSWTLSQLSNDTAKIRKTFSEVLAGIDTSKDGGKK